MKDPKLEKKVVLKRGNLQFELLSLGMIVALAHSANSLIVCHKSAVFDHYITLEDRQ